MGEVYDVTSNPRIYGPGGSYSFFSGRDASRAYITGCFDDPVQLTHDLRGLSDEDMSVSSPRASVCVHLSVADLFSKLFLPLPTFAPACVAVEEVLRQPRYLLQSRSRHPALCGSQ